MEETGRTLSVIIPCYNEENTVFDTLERVAAVTSEIPLKEIIVVDDYSNDKSHEAIERFSSSHPNLVRYLRHEKNAGKGAAIHTGLVYAAGDIITVQDADSEYNPCDFIEMYRTLTKSGAKAVFGSRFLNKKKHPDNYIATYFANRFLTFLTNVVTGSRLTDMETCYKMIDASVIKKIVLNEKRFGFEPELTIKLSRLIRKDEIIEVPISYTPRKYSHGKKIRIKDGIEAVIIILKYGLFGCK